MEPSRDSSGNKGSVGVEVLAERVTGLRELYDQQNKLNKENVAEYRALTKEMISEHNRLTQLAIDKAEESMKTKTDSMNEFRAQQKDMQTTLATQEKVDEYIKTNNDKLYQLEKNLLQNMSQNLTTLTEKFDLQISSNKAKIEKIDDWKNNMQGRGFVLLLLWPIIVALIGWIITHLN